MQPTLPGPDGPVRNIAPDVLDRSRQLQILPSAYWQTTTPVERFAFGQHYGYYSFPTVELVDHLRDAIAGRSAIEVGAGSGVLAAALGIKGTDSRQQEKTPYREYYRSMGQAIAPYGRHVIELDAAAAVRHFRPEVVIGCWVTHKWLPQRHEAGGNIVGLDEEDILANCQTYIVVGNEQVHASKSIWDLPHRIEHPPYVYSRAINGAPEFIATWSNPLTPRSPDVGGASASAGVD